MSYELRISACCFHDKTPLKYEILNENIARKHHFFSHESNTYLRSPCLEQRLPRCNSIVKRLIFEPYFPIAFRDTSGLPRLIRLTQNSYLPGQ